MPRKLIYKTKEEKLEMKRNSSKKYYHNGNGKKYHRLRYLMRKNNISREELEGLETVEEKIEYCHLVHIKNKDDNTTVMSENDKNKYGIRVADIDDNKTVMSENDSEDDSDDDHECFIQ